MVKKVITFSMVTLLIVAGAMAYLFPFGADTTPEPVQKTIEPTKEPVVDPIALRISKMSLEEKIGQMLIVGFEHTYLDDHIQKMIKEYHIGGINLLKRNVEDSSQMRQLTQDLQNISTIPLFIATDQEGGKNIRFNFLKELSPQTKIKTSEQAKKIAFDRAIELRALGVNMNFSPVLDYVSDKKAYLYSRTFGTDPNTTGLLANAMIEGYAEGGVVPVAKHFPGYSNISLDPHTNKATSNMSEEELVVNLAPFKSVIERNPFVAIMTAHVLIPSVDSNIATVSSKFLTEILRTQLLFKGVIITDDMEMASAGNSTGKMSVDAVKAGADMIISTYDPKKQIIIFEHLQKAVLDGEITEKRIDDSVTRILILKSKMTF